jgi:Flp pilus assembly protein TadD
MALDRANQLTRAEQEYRRAIELAPDSATLQNLGGLLCFTGRREEGVRNLLAASAMSPKDGKILAGVGKILMTNEQYELAADHLARALRRGFETAAVHYQLAACLATMGKLEAAVPEYEAAIRLDPKHQGAQEELARVRSALASRATGQTGASPGVLKP